jgi:hypothetical protein
MERLKSLFRSASTVFWLIVYAILFNGLYDVGLDIAPGAKSAIICGLLAGAFLVYAVQRYKNYICTTLTCRMYNGAALFIFISLLDFKEYAASDLVIRTISAMAFYTLITLFILWLARRKNVATASP